MITLGGVTISDNMYLKGVHTSPEVLVQQDRSLNGGSHLTVQKINGGKTYTLGTTNANGSIMGIWCSSVLDQVKVLESAGVAVPLNYRGIIYPAVLIVEVPKMDPLYHFELEGPDKKYLGHITITED
jgi:hypothetical protein